MVIRIRTAANERLEALLARLARVEETAPAGAERLHARRTALTAKVAAALESWRPRLDDKAFAELEAAVARLEAAAPIAIERLAEIDGLGAEVADLATRAAAAHADDPAGRVEAKVAGWRGELAALAATAGLDDGEAPRSLAAIEAEMRLAFQALYWLGQLRQALGGFAEAPPDALAAAAERLREELAESPPSEAWVARARKLFTEVKERAELEARRPRELEVVGRLLPRLRGWADTLELRQAEVRQLGRRYQEIVVADWTTPLPAELAREAERLDGELGEAAEGRRREGLDRLGRRLDELVEACGEQPALREALAALATRELKQPQTFRGFRAELERAAERLAAVANNHLQALERQLEGRLAELERSLATLRADPLSDAVAASAHAVELGARALAGPADATALLAALVRSRELLAEAGVLREQALGEVEALRAAQVRLRTLDTELLHAAAQLDEPIDTLEGPIEELTRVSAGAGSLESCQRAATRLEEELEARRRRFVERARGRVRALVGELTELEAALAFVDAGRQPAALPVLGEGATPQEAVAALGAAEVALADRRDDAEEAARALESSCRAAVAALDGLDAADGDPAEAEAIRRLLGELSEVTLDASPSTPAGLRRLGGLRARAERLRDHREASARALADRVAALRSRLRHLVEEGPEELHPRWMGRLSGLVYGLPERPAVAALHQIEEAETLASRLEEAAGRLVARRFAADLVTFRARPPASADGLAAELAALSSGEVPPARLRHRLRQALRDVRV